jgi:phosphoribosylamine--glycine ligase
VGASKGYPGDYSHVKGREITGFDDARKVDGVTILGAAIQKVDNKYYANGGRLFDLVVEGNDAGEAIGRAYEGMSHIHIYDNEGVDLLHSRKDIGQREIKHLLI